MATKIQGLMVGLGLAFVQCGGRAEAEPPEGGVPTAAGSGGTTNTDGCDDAGVSEGGAAAEGGCGDDGGATPLARYARLRTACGLNVNVDQQGHPVAICFHIK